MESQQETRDFGEVLRHELARTEQSADRNPRQRRAASGGTAAPQHRAAVLRLETIATLAVRVRETVRRLSEDWETQLEHAAEQLEAHPS